VKRERKGSNKGASAPQRTTEAGAAQPAGAGTRKPDADAGWGKYFL
jgi:hypothetical protein